MGSKLTIAIIIPTLNRSRYLKETLASLSLQSYLPDEVIVVDNGSTQDSNEILNNFKGVLNIRCIREKERSIPKARNCGIKHTSSDILVFTDDDCILDIHWLENAIRPFSADPQIGLVGGEILTESLSNSIIERYFVDCKMSRVGIESTTRWRRGYQPGIIPAAGGFTAIHPFFTCANMAVRRSVFESVGTFDTQLKTNEDLELCIRSTLHGWKLYFEPAAIVVHRPQRKFFSVLKKWFYYSFYHPRLLKKYDSKMAHIYIYKSWQNNPFPNFVYFLARFPITAVVFINSFLLMHISIVFALICKFLQYESASVFFGLLFLLSLVRYIWLRLDQKSILRSLRYIGINYALNLSYILGALIGGMREGMLYVEATIDEAR